MIEYIPRQAAIAAVIEARMPDTTPDGTPIANGKRSVSDCVRRIRDIPAADVQPVKHGKWVNDIQCSNCGWYMEDDVTVSPMMVFFDYCPNCGAKMDSET